MRRLGIVIVIAFAAVVGAMAACKQGEGERCQVEEDCEDGLICNAATNTCESMNVVGADGDFLPDGGTPTVDARPADARPPDADPPDAMP
jgi:hypothetical protein